MFPTLADTTYFPGISPTNLPSSRIKPEAKLLLSKDLPVKEYSTGISLSLFPFLSRAIISKFTTSPVFTLELSEIKFNSEIGFF